MQRIRLGAPELRDIIDDLKARLSVVLDEREHLLARAKLLDDDVQLLQRMIEREQERQKPAEIARPAQGQPEALPDFIFKAIQMRAMSRDDLRHAAANAGYRVDGRNIHATTFNLKRRGKIVEIEDGVFASADSDLAKSALRAPSH